MQFSFSLIPSSVPRRSQGVPPAPQGVLRGHAAALGAPRRLPLGPYPRHRRPPGLQSAALPVPRQRQGRRRPGHPRRLGRLPGPERDRPVVAALAARPYHLPPAACQRLGPSEPEAVLPGGVPLYR